MPPTKTVERVSAADAAHAWNDPEFWGPKGRGCSWCHCCVPIVRGLPFGGNLCHHCIERAFQGWDFDRVVTWLGAQRTAYIRQEKRRAAIEAWRRGKDELIIAYREEYGVWLAGDTITFEQYLERVNKGA